MTHRATYVARFNARASLTHPGGDDLCPVCGAAGGCEHDTQRSAGR